MSSCWISIPSFSKQRANKFWYKEGDLNTRFFHMTINKKRSRNSIKHLQDEAGG